MPLLDHFHPPLNPVRHWESFHGSWATMLAGQLNRGALPRGYVAEPHVTLGVEVETDVGTFEEEEEAGRPTGAGSATAYAPPKPRLTVPVDFAGIDLFEVRIHAEESWRDLAAAIELISPANKDRPGHRQAFITKCANYLQSGVAVLIVDVVTSRRANLHLALLAFLGHHADGNGRTAGELYAAAYRTATKRKKVRLEVWPERLTLGAELPTLPLWLAEDLAVPVDLEKSYADTCELLRIPPKKR